MLVDFQRTARSYIQGTELSKNFPISSEEAQRLPAVKKQHIKGTCNLRSYHIAKIAIFWDVKPCSLAHITNISEKSDAYVFSGHIPEDSYLQAIT
jgi:Ser-tRNA(Ala) deacylase AlaX